MKIINNTPTQKPIQQEPNFAGDDLVDEIYIVEATTQRVARFAFKRFLRECNEDPKNFKIQDVKETFIIR